MSKRELDQSNFEPKLVAFCCNWCSYPAADGAGASRMQYPVNVHILRIPCGGRVNPGFVLRAFELGADGVLVATCHFEDCHYMFGARQAAENYKRLETVVRILGMGKRMRLEWISAAESPKFVRVIREMTEEVRKIGPNPMRLRASSLTAEQELATCVVA
ncbi:MAG: hydrogenase iron-sulfur subunit [Acidobacteria bacterium]|nr:hydrogenase iron-sulfur subunit [Acidobacteriota bacterium]